MYSIELLIAAAVVPAIVLLLLVYRMDKIEKEPWSLLGKLLMWGAICGIPAAVVEGLMTWGLNSSYYIEEGSLLYCFIEGFLVAALVEESLKFLFLYLVTFKNREFNYRFDGVIYAVFVSMGFAILENILYVLANGFAVAIARAILSLPLHAICGVYMGISYGRQKVRSLTKPTSMGRVALACLPMSILIHGCYDFFAFAAQEQPIFFLFFLVFVIVVFIVSVIRLKKAAREDRPVDDRPIAMQPVEILPGEEFDNDAQ